MAFERFCENVQSWLDDYALFMALKNQHRGAMWTSWGAPLRHRDSGTLRKWSRKLAPELRALKCWQFEFFRQWDSLKRYCQQRSIRFMGDVPIYVAHDSADV